MPPPPCIQAAQIVWGNGRTSSLRALPLYVKDEKHAPCGAEGTASRRNPRGRDPGHHQEAGWPRPDGRGRSRGRGLGVDLRCRIRRRRSGNRGRCGCRPVRRRHRLRRPDPWPRGTRPDPARRAAGVHRRRVRRPRTGAQPRRRRHRHRGDGVAAAHHPGAVDGRAVEPGEPGRLSRRHRIRQRLPARLSHDDDRRRHRPAGPRLRRRCRSRRSAGHRHRPPPGRHRLRHRRPSRRQGRDQVARRHLRRASRTRKPPARPVPTPEK